MTTTDTTNTDQADERAINFWCNVLLAGVGLILLLSIGMIVPPHPSIAYFNFILYGQTGFPETMSFEAVRYATFLYQLMACIMIGWMVPLIYLAHVPLRQGSMVAWKIFALSLGTWYVVDSGISILVGYWQNAVSNTSLVVIFAVALIAIRARLVAGQKT